jgi:hypothetical protein
MNFMAARRSAQPLYAVFLERVINIQAVQRHRAAVADDDKLPPWLFFSVGCRPKLTGNFRWSLDAPDEEFPGAPPEAPFDSVLNPISPPMQLAWDAAVAAFKEFIKAIKTGELIANGVHPATGERRDLDPAEWTRTHLVLDVRNGDLFEEHYIKHVRRSSKGDQIEWRNKKQLRWSSITLRVVKQRGQKKTRGHGYDWAEAWAYALTLRAEDQWDWGQFKRDKKQPLPAVRKVIEDKIAEWFKARGSVPDIGDIRRNITIPLYAGRRTRSKRKR